MLAVLTIDQVARASLLKDSCCRLPAFIATSTLTRQSRVAREPSRARTGRVYVVNAAEMTVEPSHHVNLSVSQGHHGPFPLDERDERPWLVWDTQLMRPLFATNRISEIYATRELVKKRSMRASGAGRRSTFSSDFESWNNVEDPSMVLHSPVWTLRAC